tara:strand:+ start:499 stop:732 length:234 start_codon:yes stop_codon:yes gene_type:complete
MKNNSKILITSYLFQENPKNKTLKTLCTSIKSAKEPITKKRVAQYKDAARFRQSLHQLEQQIVIQTGSYLTRRINWR